MRGLNPRQIEAFRAVVLTGSVSAAASLISVTQPAVSRMIRDLQHQLGLVLFERRGTGLVPTSEALSLYAEVERAFVGLERIAQMATELRTRRAGFLRIAAMPALANGFLPRFLGQFLEDHPKLDIVLTGLVSHAILASVAQGQCDLGFAEASMEHAAVERDVMPAAPLLAVLPERHRLARRKRLRPADFEGENFISLGPSALSRFSVDRVFAEHGIHRVLRIETPLSEIACALAGSGAGVTLCEPFTATEYATRDIVVRPFEPRIDFEFAVLYAAHRSLPPVAREFVDGFRAHVTAFLRRRPWQAARATASARK